MRKDFIFMRDQFFRGVWGNIDILRHGLKVYITERRLGTSFCMRILFFVLVCCLIDSNSQRLVFLMSC